MYKRTLFQLRESVWVNNNYVNYMITMGSLGGDIFEGLIINRIYLYIKYYFAIINSLLLTDDSNIILYSFGVVLMELATGKQPIF